MNESLQETADPIPSSLRRGVSPERELLSEYPALDPSDPIDALLAEFIADIEDVEADRLPTGVEQRDLIAGIRRGDVVCTQDLVKIHRGFLAAVAFPFKRSDIPSEELLLRASQALVQSAREFESDRHIDFNDHAVTAVRRSLGEVTGGEESAEADDPGRPMESLLRGVSETLPELRSRSRHREGLARRKAERQRAERRTQGLDGLSALQREMLPNIHLPDGVTSAREGRSVGAIGAVYRRASRNLGFDNRRELALWAAAQGMSFDLKERPPVQRFTTRERQVGTRLCRTDSEIAKDLKVTLGQVRLSVMALFEKTKARTRTELALMAGDDFEPRPEELVDRTPVPLRDFTPVQRLVLEHIHLPRDVIAEQTGRSNNNVASVIHRAVERAEAPNETALAVRLSEAGMTFDVPDPRRPLNEVLSEKKAEVAWSLHMTSDERRRETGLTDRQVDSIVAAMCRETGARTRVELALMVREFDTGDYRVVEYRELSPEERFYRKLGIKTLLPTRRAELLGMVTSAQREAIQAYYFSEKPRSWRDIGKQLGISHSTARRWANEGIEQIRKRLKADNLVTLEQPVEYGTTEQAA